MWWAQNLGAWLPNSQHKVRCCLDASLHLAEWHSCLFPFPGGIHCLRILSQGYSSSQISSQASPGFFAALPGFPLPCLPPSLLPEDLLQSGGAQPLTWPPHTVPCCKLAACFNDSSGWLRRQGGNTWKGFLFQNAVCCDRTGKGHQPRRRPDRRAQLDGLRRQEMNELSWPPMVGRLSLIY